jgi:hypothetical protein
LVESVIAACHDDPGKLASAAFNEAARLVRERDPEEWFRLRVELKRAKPSGVLLGDIDQAARPPGDGDEESAVADVLAEMATSKGELFHDPEGSAFFAERGSPAKTFKIGVKAFAERLSYAFYAETKGDGPRGRAASDAAIKTAIVALTGIAVHDGEEKAVFLRAAPWANGYLVDLRDGGVAGHRGLADRLARLGQVARPVLAFGGGAAFAPPDAGRRLGSAMGVRQRPGGLPVSGRGVDVGRLAPGHAVPRPGTGRPARRRQEFHARQAPPRRRS